MTKKRRLLEEVNISFLDVMSCGFGAIVLLLIVAPIGDPSAVEDAEKQLAGSVKQLTEQLFDLRGETTSLNRQLSIKQQQRVDLEDRIARLVEELAAVKTQSNKIAQSATTEEDELRLALQVLSEEQQRLLGQNYRRSDNAIGGIPVDSEYVIFVIDTSGSMQAAAWQKVRDEMIHILDIYPKVKGLQVLNDMGQYLFDIHKGSWIKDNSDTRADIIKALKSWRPFSNSSPTEGIELAIRTFYAADKKISIYVLGDDFTGRSVKHVIKTVAKLNQQRRSGNRLVRIHAIGFPVHYQNGDPNPTAIRFANLMRELSYQNGGTFVGLNDLK